MLFNKRNQIHISKILKSCLPPEEAGKNLRALFCLQARWYAEKDKTVIQALREITHKVDQKMDFPKDTTLEYEFGHILKNMIMPKVPMFHQPREDSTIENLQDALKRYRKYRQSFQDMLATETEKIRCSYSHEGFSIYAPRVFGGYHSSYYLAALVSGASYAHYAVAIMQDKINGHENEPDAYATAKKYLHVYNECLDSAKEALCLPLSITDNLKKAAMGEIDTDTDLHGLVTELQCEYRKSIKDLGNIMAMVRVLGLPDTSPGANNGEKFIPPPHDRGRIVRYS